MSLSSYTAIALAEKSQDFPTPIAVPVKLKKQLAREVLVELGVGKQYDLYFWNSVDLAYGAGTRTKVGEWLQKTLAQVAGWKYVESQYVSRLEANFSAIELQELLELAKRPLMKKLLLTEIQAFEETGEKRALLLFRAWEDYNAGKINVPQGLLK
ncbi:MAG: DUF2059 domain-containing protein [Pseudanabaena frigida]|uniref:DUF2059 domain-containing protein n=1 Tax=Pseudanabaena frigida TaxID=945775 RepID=A0A2W4VV53_9CYAN|nr:MAG: DUF2059 domain-containing protein [Pseudanabaena frigida]